jgi:hypothetical protein
MGNFWWPRWPWGKETKTMAMNTSLTQAQIDQLNQLQHEQSLTIGSYGASIGSGPYSGPNANGIYYPVTTSTASNVYTSGYAATHTSPCYKNLEDGWGDHENQEAAGYGWILTNPQTFTHITPHLTALSFGTKTAMTDEEILQDVVTHAMSNCPIAYKILCILSKNRSPYAQWEETVRVLKEKY